MSELTRDQKIWLVISEIPAGKVATYSQIAQLAGYPNAARLVGSVLGQLPPGSQLPWHRVINCRGEISFAMDSSRYRIQRERLEQEGIVFANTRLSLADYRWDGIAL